MYYLKNFVILVAGAFILLFAGCSSSDQFQGFSYDPPGSLVTEDKEITPQYHRTIGIERQGIWFSNEFPGARMNDFYPIHDSLYQIVVQPENAPINNSPWYAFKAWSDRPKKINVQLSYKHGDHRYYPDISRDGKTWKPIDAGHYKADTLTGRATLTLPLSRDTLWISAQEIVDERYIDHWADSALNHSFVSRETIGYSHQNRPIKKFSITEVPPGRKRGVILILSRLHPPEVTGNLACLAFLEEVAGNSELSRTFRKQFEILAFPFANPDGVQNGHWRHNAGGVDLNRDWHHFNQPETKAIRDDLLTHIKQDSLRKVYYGIDFHSTDENIFYPIDREIDTFPEDFTFHLLDSLTASYPDIEFNIEPFDTSSPIAKNWIHRTFGADAVTYEVNDTANRDTLESIAQTYARLIMAQLVQMKR